MKWVADSPLDAHTQNTGCYGRVCALTFEFDSRDNFLRENKTKSESSREMGSGQKNLNQDVRDYTMRELWHKLWGKWGLPDERLNTCTGTATNTHRQIRGSLPELKMNSVTSLSHSGFSSLPPSAFVYCTKWSGAWAFSQSRPIFHPLTRPTYNPLPHPSPF